MLDQFTTRVSGASPAASSSAPLGAAFASALGFGSVTSSNNSGPSGGGSNALSVPVASGVPPRILVVGDNGVGKSLFVHLVCSMCNTGRAALPTARIESTTGFAVDACVWRTIGGRHAPTATPHGGGSSGSATATLVEFVEVGGNRNFALAARKACYRCPTSACDIAPGVAIGIPSASSGAPSGAPSFSGFSAAGGPSRRIDGVIFVYDAGNGDSVVALQDWFAELEACDVLSTGAPFLVVGAAPRGGSGGSGGGSRGGSGVVGSGSSVGARLRSAAPLTPVWALWAWTQQVLLVLVSIVLFGPSQSVVPLRRRPTAKQALAALENHAQCAAFVDGIPLHNPAEFALQREEWAAFLNTVVARSGNGVMSLPS